MPRPRKSVPPYTHHKPTNQAFVRVPDGNGGRRFVYLGRFDSPESHAEYRRVLAELEAAPAGIAVAGTSPTASTPSPLLNQIILGFLRWALTHYRQADGSPTSEIDEIKRSIAPLRKLYGHAPAAQFGPKALAAVRQHMVGLKWCRTLINRRVDRVKRMFKWAASEELSPVTVYQALRTLPGLQAGRTEASESKPVEPAAAAQVATALPFLNAHVRAMVELQLASGMRPGEVRRLTLAQVDRSGELWLYRPTQHKSRHRGKARVVVFGPKARAVLDAFLAGRTVPPDVAVFNPAREREERFAAMRAKRKSKVQPSQESRKKKNPKRRPRTSYSATAYDHAIARACERAGVPPLAPKPTSAHVRDGGPSGTRP